MTFTTVHPWTPVAAGEILDALAKLKILARCKHISDIGLVEVFTRQLPKEEAVRRFQLLDGWLLDVMYKNHDGVILTRAVAEFFAQPTDFDALMAEVEHVRSETLHGRFRLDNPLQKDLEFQRFANEYGFLHPEVNSTGEQYRVFNSMERLALPVEEQYKLTEKDLAAARRVAYEDIRFLRFLREFKASTTRPIVVVGNDRYGRFWFVEPLEEILKREGFTLRYDRVPSLYTHRLTVPSAFPRDFVKEINETMPHLVIADGSNTSRASDRFDVMNFSKAHHSYANWFATFNDIRAGGDVATYQDDSVIPAVEIPELRKWHQFVTQRHRLEAWVTPGETYTVTTWAPTMKALVRIGEDVVVPRKPVEFAGDKPLAVLANPIMYETRGDDLPQVLKDAPFYHYNDPERKIAEKVIFGFGDHGVETQVVGPTTAQFVSAAQEAVTAEVERLLRSG